MQGSICVYVCVYVLLVVVGGGGGGGGAWADFLLYLSKDRISSVPKQYVQ